jgi:hypothetical protein
VWFGAQSAYALAEARLGDWRLDASVAALRTKLGQTAAPELAAVGGSFLEATLRATWRPDRAWRIDGRYRARLRDDSGRSQRAELSLAWRCGALDVQLRGGADLHHDARPPGFASHRMLLWFRTASPPDRGGDLRRRGGGRGAGDEADGRRPAAAPATSASRFGRAAGGFVHAFATRGAWFAGSTRRPARAARLRARPDGRTRAPRLPW